MAPLTVLDTPLTLFHDPASPESEFALEALQLGSRQFEVRRIDLPSSRPTTAELRDLAGRLGFTKSALYHHVPSKEHLLQQALDEALDNLSEAVAAARSDTSVSALERLRRAVRGSGSAPIRTHLPPCGRARRAEYG